MDLRASTSKGKYNHYHLIDWEREVETGEVTFSCALEGQWYKWKSKMIFPFE